MFFNWILPVYLCSILPINLSSRIALDLPQGLYVNEVIATNPGDFTDNFGNASDWIEIFNNTDAPVDLHNYYISDNPNNLTKFRLEGTDGSLIIPAKGFLILWADSKPNLGSRHLNFGLSSDGESVVLTEPNGVTIVHQLEFPQQYEDMSFGLASDNLETRYFKNRSPGASNNMNDAFIGILDPPILSHTSEFTSSLINVTAFHPDPEVKIYYSIDGTEPKSEHTDGSNYPFKNRYPQTHGEQLYSLGSRTMFSYLYTSPVTLQDPNTKSNNISTINFTNERDAFIPSSNVHKSSIISFAASKPGYLTSKTLSRSFFVNSASRHSLPIFSVNIQESYLFDYYDGISVAGIDYDTRFLNKRQTVETGNWQRRGGSSQRNANFNFLSKDLTSDYNIGIRVQGNSSRRDKKKSFRLMFNNIPEFLTDKEHRIATKILRSPGKLPKTDIGTRIIRGMNVGVRDGFVGAMYLNGEYWGTYNVTNYYGPSTLSILYNVDEDLIDVIKADQLSDGEISGYNSLMTFIDRNSMSNSSNYDSLKALIDVKSFIDYVIAETFMNNNDWINNNITMWRVRSNTYKGKKYSYNDGRFRWIVEDQDHSLYSETDNAIQRLQEAEAPISLIFNKASRNLEFKREFANRYADLSNTLLKKDRVLEIYDRLKEQYDTEIHNEIARWESFPTKRKWDDDMYTIQSFLDFRTDIYRSHTQGYYGSTGTFDLTVISADTSKGSVQVNSILINNQTPGVPEDYKVWTGRYFQNIDLVIKAVPRLGYKFSHWKLGESIIYEKELTLNTSSNKSYTVYFVPELLSENPQPETAYVLEDCTYIFENWSSDAESSSAPQNGVFVYLDQKDPTESSQIEGFTSGSFDLSSGSRINGLGEDGFSFINTGSGNEGYEEGKLGGFILAINTIGIEEASVSWTAKTITANPRKYKLKLYYREGDVQLFKSFNPVIEYQGSATDGHTEYFTNIKLPQELLNKPYVQLFWKYFHSGIGSEGRRDQLAITDINVTSVKRYQGTQGTEISSGQHHPGKIVNNAKIDVGATLENYALNSVELTPGFETNSNVVFKAEIKTCK